MINKFNINNIGVIGGGNIGTELAGELTHRGFNVYLYTSKVEKFNKKIKVIEEDLNLIYEEEIYSITDDLKELCENCSVLIITLPSCTFKNFASKLGEIINKGTKLIILPGTGGCEFTFKKIIDSGCTLFGLQRVPGVYRLKEYGKYASISGRRKTPLVASSIPYIGKENIKEFVEFIFNMPCNSVDNYLNITLTPSNPLLHTSRLYSMFKDYDPNYEFDRNILFYKEWNDISSQNIIACDNELKNIKKMLSPIDLTNVMSLLEYYESHDAPSMTKKISSIQSLSNILSPMKELDNGKYIIDWNSRYFTADFPQGIIIIKAIAMLCNIDTPMIDKIINWYQISVDKKFFKNNMKEFDKDIIECNIPQNYGIHKLEELKKYYD